jgi:hypothetical protein
MLLRSVGKLVVLVGVGVWEGRELDDAIAEELEPARQADGSGEEGQRERGHYAQLCRVGGEEDTGGLEEWEYVVWQRSGVGRAGARAGRGLRMGWILVEEEEEEEARAACGCSSMDVKDEMEAR